MQGSYFQYALLIALAIGLLLAAYTDLRRREIDNWLNAAIALGAPLFWIASGLTWPEIGYQLAIALATFAVLAGLFALGAMGGGDVKLLTALALWIQPMPFLKLIVIMALVGGILTLVFGAWHVIRRNRTKIAIPYGIAISVAGLWIIADQYLPAAHAGASLG